MLSAPAHSTEQDDVHPVRNLTGYRDHSFGGRAEPPVSRVVPEWGTPQHPSDASLATVGACSRHASTHQLLPVQSRHRPKVLKNVLRLGVMVG